MEEEDFYCDEFYQHEPIRRQIFTYMRVPASFGAGIIPRLPQDLADQDTSRCDVSRLVGFFTSVLNASGADFPSFSTLSKRTPGITLAPCEHIYDGLLWCTKMEFGRLFGSGKVVVNLRMPNDGFVYLSPAEFPLVPHIDPSQPTVARHYSIPFWHEVDMSTLPTSLEPFVVYFLNWLCGRSPTSLEPLPDTIPTFTVQAWYNDAANRMDIELSAPTPDGRECVWSLAFAPDTPITKGAGVFTAADLTKFHAAQVDMKR